MSNGLPTSSSPSGTPSLPPAPAPPRWQPMNSRQRRVVGVLVEKAKTVPDSYPMTINAIVNGCNQKNNREPQMAITEEEVQEVLEELRAIGAVSEVQGSGRVSKFKHHLYEWLGVDKVEIAVMTELLLRGEQTVGELRGRAARMEPIADVSALQTILQSLLKKNLILELTSAGRGQMVTHNLYKERELVELKTRFASGGTPAQVAPNPSASSTSSAGNPPPRATSTGFQPGVTVDMYSELRLEVAELRAEVARLRNDVRELQEKLA